MAWVRLDDRAIDHPKFLALTAEAFRLWFEGMSYCNKHLTDGLLTSVALKGFRYVSRSRVAELVTHALWETHEGGFKVHDYLEWNDGREAVMASREQARLRQATSRARHGVTRHVTNAGQTPFVRSGVDLKNEERSEKESEGKPSRVLTADALGADAARLLERYPELYRQHRHGARLKLLNSSLDFTMALDLVKTWDTARLEQLAVIFLTTDEDWISRTDRGFRVFAAKASWCDDRLSAAEKAS